MRTILMALVLGLVCTTHVYAQPETIPPTVGFTAQDAPPPPADAVPATQAAPPVKQTPVKPAEKAPQEAAAPSPAPQTVIVEESVKSAAQPAAVCVGDSCRLRQPVRNLVVRPVVNFVQHTGCAVRQSSCVQRVRIFRQCRPRLFVRRCR